MASPRHRIRGRLLPGLGPDGAAGPVEVTVDGDRIVAVEPCSTGDADLILAPGFVDLQVNGVGAHDCSSPDADWGAMAADLAASGVTAWLPTVITRELDGYPEVLDRIQDAAGRAAVDDPALLGLHLEGPFLGDRPGAHPPHHVVPIDLAWLEALPATVRLLTLGPEQPASAEATALLASKGVVVSLGHTAATRAQMTACIDAGASMVTHLFNAMAPLDHRSPGPVGTALADPRVAVGLIADGVHVDASLLPVVFAAAGDRVVLVTDQIGWANEQLRSLGIEVVDGAPRLPDGTIAGSALTMDAGIRICVDAGVPLEAALRAATSTPASVLGDAERGRLVPGRRADIVVLDEQLAVQRTIIGGRART